MNLNECLNCGKEVKNKYCDVSCQNSHQNKSRSDKRFGLFKDFIVICTSCEKEFIVNERENLHPKKKNYFCSRGCANKRTDDKSETKKIICILCNNEKLINKRSSQKMCNKCSSEVRMNHYKCKMCEREFQSKKKNRIFCSRSCQSTYWNKNNRDVCVKAGLKSVQSQSRRSKNEVLFADLCIKKFSNVLVNDPMFNGWDADVIIQDLKIAVLWNGRWHYDQISKSQSLSQIQNRDKIKVREIKKCGYTPYIIKDMGKLSIDKVNTEWDKFLEWSKFHYRTRI